MDVKVKICGITNLADAQAAIAAGADLLGFIFFPKSLRYVAPEQVRDILASLELGQASVLTVGVFVNEPVQTVAQILSFCGLDVAQLHGEEPPAMLGLDDRLAGDLTMNAMKKSKGESRSMVYGRAYKALRPRTLEEATAMAGCYALPPRLRARGRLPALLLDTYHPDRRGGTGQLSDWELASLLARQYPLLLAGGLLPTNVARAVHAVKPWGVDVASGVEASPRQKDHAAMQTFVAAVKDRETKKS